MKIKIWFLIFFILWWGILFFINQTNTSKSFFDDFLQNFDTFKHWDILISWNLIHTSNHQKKHLNFYLSWKSENKFSWNLSLELSQHSAEIAENYTFQSNTELFLEKNDIYFTPSKIYRRWGTGNIQNSYRNSIFSPMINKTFKTTHNSSLFEYFHKQLLELEKNKNINLTIGQTPLKLTITNNKLFLHSKEQTANNFLIKIIGTIQKNKINLRGYRGKRNIKLTIKITKKSGSLEWSIQHNENHESLKIHFIRNLKSTKSSLQSFSKPYTNLQEYLETLNIKF